MIVGQDKREIGIAGFKRDDDRVRPVRSDLDNRIDNRFGRRFRVVPTMIVQRRRDIVRGYRPAVVEFDTLTQLEGPDRRIIGGSRPRWERAYCPVRSRSDNHSENRRSTA